MESPSNLWRRMLLVIGRGRVALANDAGAVQLLQVVMSAAEIQDHAPRLAEYGFTSNPPPGSDVAMVFLGGNRTDGLVIATGNQQYRLKGLAPGEVALYDDAGQVVRLTPAGIVITAPLGLTVNGNTIFNGTVTANGHRIDDTHKHGGVQTGGGNTGTPL